MPTEWVHTGPKPVFRRQKQNATGFRARLSQAGTKPRLRFTSRGGDGGGGGALGASQGRGSVKFDLPNNASDLQSEGWT